MSTEREDPMTTPFAKVTHVILDLDGTLINTEQLVDEVVSAVLHKRGDFTASRVRKAMEHVRGMRPGDGTRAVMDLPTPPMSRQTRSHKPLLYWTRAGARSR